ncbi:MAG: flagellar protein FlgN [Lachnospiraceae bacterium]|nr:flagellar protein FlgN [Lachnospiraceae bacterium]
MENLIDILGRESTEYEGLLEISQRKTPVIVSGNLEDLQKITDEEQNVVNKLNVLERERVQVTKDIATVLNRDVNKLTLTNLIGLLQARPAEQGALAELHDRLHRTVHELQRVNEQNGSLLKDALEMVEFEINMLQASRLAPETANYNRGAYSAGSTMGVTRGFDAKQ